MRSKKVIYNIGTNLLLQVIVIIYGFIVPKIIISHFGSNVNGLIFSITQFLAYITLLESGFGPVIKSALYKPIAFENEKEINNILNTSEKFFKKIAYIFIIYIMILCIIYPLIINTDFDVLFTISLIIIISISTFAEYFFGITYRLFLQAKQMNYIVSIIQIVTYILSTILIFALAHFGANIHLIKLASGLIFTLKPLLQNYYVKKRYNINLKDSDKKYNLKQKWDGFAQHIAAVIHSNTDITILTIFCNLYEVSVYSVYSLVVNGIKRLVESFSSGIDSLFGDMIAKEEDDNLRKKFNLYEILYFSIVTISFTCAIILIVPFVENYTRGITDTNYIRHIFGYLIVISEYIWAIRLPYSSITLAAGHFKETRKGAWVECISNIVISIILVYKFGIVGVTIGTIIAMLVRTCEFVYHTNKYILKRKCWESVFKILLIILETLLIILVSKSLPLLPNVNYFNWLVNACIVGFIALLTVCIFNYIFYKSNCIEILKLLKNKITKRRVK